MSSACIHGSCNARGSNPELSLMDTPLVVDIINLYISQTMPFETWDGIFDYLECIVYDELQSMLYIVDQCVCS